MMLAATLAALGAAPTSSIGASGTGASAPGPRGIYLYPYPYALQNGDWERALAVPGIDGTAVVLNWAELMPSGPKSYDCAGLDVHAPARRARRQAARLRVLPS
jgi:hypothetical protein